MSAPAAAIPAGARRTAPGGRDVLWLIALWTVCTAYNLFKPFHIDDGAHLLIARWIEGHPLHPMSGILNWSGVDEPIWRTNQPHLYFYLLAAWGRIAGFSEPAMHALQSLATLAAIFLFHRLARFVIGAQALWATALLALGPAFLVEQNLMVDVPLLATWLTFFNLIVCEVDSPHQTRRYALAALALSAAVMIKYSSLALFPILVLSLILERRKGQAWTALIPILALIAWSAFNVFDYGHVHILARQDAVARSRFRIPLLAFGWVMGLGALTPLGLMAAGQTRALSRISWALYLGAALTFAALAIGVFSGRLPERLSDKALWALFVVNGAATALALVPQAWALARIRLWRLEAMRDVSTETYLFLWILGTTAFYCLFTPFLAARHVLLIMPPVILLLAKSWGSSLSGAAKVFGLAFAVILSAGLALSDWRFADFNRSEAALLGRTLPRAGTIWAGGHWGWQWYADNQGFREVDLKASPMQPGDLWVVARDAGPGDLRRPVKLQLLKTDTEDLPLLSFVCSGRPSRLYLFTPWEGPWSFSRDCVEHIDVYRVTAPSP